MLNKTTHKIINDDSRQMSEIKDKSVHLIVTSPPYWQLKDYGSDNQIGFHDSYESYINNLNLVWSECNHVLHDGCRLCINIGDQFARSVYYGRYKLIPIHSGIIRFCETIGLDFMRQIIWQKATTMKPTQEQKANAAMTNEEWNTYFNGHWYCQGAKQDQHLAMFPEELPHRLIKMFSFPEETVLDPFMGSGTTALAARNLNRNSIGYEINPEFILVIKEKIGSDDAFNKVEINVLTQNIPSFQNLECLISELPYQFVDTHKLDKKIDVKKIQYGSKLDADSTDKREEYFSVKEIISPELIRLNNDLIIRLIGIKQTPKINGQATEYLKDKLRGKKVFLKYDECKHDRDNNLMAYLYLENKTFVIAHLLKDGMAEVDESLEFKYKNKFLMI
ncbi:methyltransferase [Bacteroidia bacterium]|nr:methyltransferase [Bacteroidia bacterium]